MAIDAEAAARAWELYQQQSGGSASKTDRRFPDQWTPAEAQPSARVGNLPRMPNETAAQRSARIQGQEKTPGMDIYVWGSGAGAEQWRKYSPEMRANMEGKLVNAGVLREGNFIPGTDGMAQHEAWELVLDWSEYYGITPLNALRKMEAEGIYRDTSGGGGGGGGAGPRTVTVIPDYETIAQNSKAMLRNQLGRDMDDWEIKLVADEMQKLYRKQAGQQLEAQLAGSGEFEITDPQTVTQAFIEEQYDPEIQRQQAIQENSANYKLSMDVLTRGAAMVE